MRYLRSFLKAVLGTVVIAGLAVLLAHVIPWWLAAGLGAAAVGILAVYTFPGEAESQ